MNTRQLLSLALAVGLVGTASALPGAQQPKQAKLVSAQQAPGRSVTQIASAAFSPDGRLLAVGGYKVVRVLETATGKTVSVLTGCSGTVSALAFSPKGNQLVAGGGEPGRKGEARLWDISRLPGGAPLPTQVLEGPNDAIYSVSFSPNGRWLASASYDHDVTVWDLGGGSEVGHRKPADRKPRGRSLQSKIQNPKSKILSDHTDAVYGLAFSPDSSLLASAAGDRTVKVWDTATSKRLYTLSDSTAELYSVAFSPDGTVLAAGGEDKALRTWHVTHKNGTLGKTAFAHQGAILRVAFADRNTIVTSGQDMLVKAWNAVTLQELRVLPKQPDWPSALAVSPRGDLIAVGTHNGALTIYGADGKLVRRPFAGQAVAVGEIRKPLPTTSAIPGRRLGDQKQRRAPGTGGATLFTASLGAISPIGMVRGGSVRLTLTGGLISDASGVYFDDPAITCKIVTPADPNRGVLRVDAMIAPNARIGVHRCWIQTPLGTTGAITFAVGAWPEVAQAEPNNTPDTAQKITAPCTIVGALDQPGDVDTFQVDVKSGDELVFEIVAQPIRSRLQPVLAVMDGSGTTLAESRMQLGRQDTVLGHRFEKPGSYRIQLRDYESAGGGDVHYRLNVGAFPLVTDAFPLGVRKGASAEIALKGFNLGTKTVKVQAPASASWNSQVETPLPGYGVARRIAVGEDPEITAAPTAARLETAQHVTTPVSISGRLAADARDLETGDRSSQVSHYFRFAAKKGERRMIDVQARRLGSPLDSEIELLDAKGKPVPQALLRVVAQTEMTFNDRDSSTNALRLSTWDTLHMNDFVLVGREVIKIDRLPKGPDEDVFFRTYRGQRIAYFGTTPEYHSNLSPVHKVEVHPPGARISPNGYPQTVLTYRNDDGGPHYGKDSHIDFTAPADGHYLVRISDTRGMSGDDFTYRLLIHPPRPDFRIVLSPDHPNIPKGGGAVISVECERYDGFDGPIEVLVTGLPAGITATAGLIEAGEFSTGILLSASNDAVTPTNNPAPVRIVAKAQIDGKEVTRAIEPDNGARLVTVLPPADLRTATDRAEVVIRPGETVVVEAQVERQGKFGARVPIDVRNLPYGVWVRDVGLNGVLVTEKDDARKFTIYCEPFVKPLTRPFFVIGNVEGGTPNAAPPLTLRVEPIPSRSARK